VAVTSCIHTRILHTILVHYFIRPIRLVVLPIHHLTKSSNPVLNSDSLPNIRDPEVPFLHSPLLQPFFLTYREGKKLPINFGSPVRMCTDLSNFDILRSQLYRKGERKRGEWVKEERRNNESYWKHRRTDESLDAGRRYRLNFV
jgi:hypothetical protein